MFTPSALLRTLAVSLTLLSTLTAAAPTPAADAELAPRACGTQAPSIIDVLRASTGDNASPGGQFTLARAGNPPYNTIKSALTFEYIPQGATGCMLQIQFPSFAADGAIANGTATQADVWSTQPFTYANLPTYNHPPVKDQFVSTVIFPTKKTTSAFKTTLASNTCSPVMSYLIELSDWQQGAGSVNFFNTLGGKQGIVPIGFSMVYNC
ncbi:hypothetical protein MMC24_003848 [Lignoscripta atroalba]|nr:hypothetical protein [Lignoscripta atroalba]